MVKIVSAASVAPNRRRGGEIRVLLSPRTVAATSGFMGNLVLEPGEFVTEHYHPYSEEFLYVTSGRLTMVVDGTPVEVGPDEALMIPTGVRHRAENRGETRVTAVFHLSPLAPRPELGHVDTEPPVNDAAAQPVVGGSVGGGTAGGNGG